MPPTKIERILKPASRPDTKTSVNNSNLKETVTTKIPLKGASSIGYPKKPLSNRCSLALSPKQSTTKHAFSSAKKPSWMKRPLPAHSGVPVPEKMKKLQERLRENTNTLDFDKYLDLDHVGEVSSSDVLIKIQKPSIKNSHLTLPLNQSTIKKNVTGKVSEVLSKVKDKPIMDSKSVKKVPLKRCSVASSPKPITINKHMTSTAKSSWKRRPLPAHSGVPVPEKMKKLQERLRQNRETNEIDYDL